MLAQRHVYIYLPDPLLFAVLHDVCDVTGRELHVFDLRTQEWNVYDIGCLVHLTQTPAPFLFCFAILTSVYYFIFSSRALSAVLLLVIITGKILED